MNSWVLILFAMTTGAIVPFQLIFNGQLGAVTKNVFTASLVVFLIGSVVLTVILLLSRPEVPRLNDLVAAPFTAWFGGFIAAGYIISIVFITPRLGVGLTTGFILVGQLVAALLLDHYGAFGNAQHTLNIGRFIGFAFMVTGIGFIKYF